MDEKHAIFEVEVPESWIGKSIGEIDVRKKYGINIMGIRENGKMNIAINPDLLLTGSITMLVLGEYKSLQKCFHI